jgi:hypothetical protein
VTSDLNMLDSDNLSHGSSGIMISVIRVSLSECHCLPAQPDRRTTEARTSVIIRPGARARVSEENIKKMPSHRDSSAASAAHGCRVPSRASLQLSASDSS